MIESLLLITAVLLAWIAVQLKSVMDLIKRYQVNDWRNYPVYTSEEIERARIQCIRWKIKYEDFNSEVHSISAFDVGDPAHKKAIHSMWEAQLQHDESTAVFRYLIEGNQRVANAVASISQVRSEYDQQFGGFSFGGLHNKIQARWKEFLEESLAAKRGALNE